MKNIITILLLLSCIPTISQDDLLIPFRDGVKWGFSNVDRKIIIPPSFDRVTSFNYGLSLVYDDGKFGAIDQKGNFVFPLDSIALMQLDSNLFIVGKRIESKIKMGVINRNGQIIIPQIYKSIRFKDSILELEDENRKVGVCNLDGQTLIPVEYDFIEIFNDNLCVVSKDENHALFTMKGKQLTKFEYMVIGDFRFGLSKVRKGDLFGYINKLGKEIRPINYEMNYPFSEGFAVIKKNSKYGLIDTLGKVIIKPKYDYLNDIHLGVASYIKDGKWGLVDIKGIEVTLPKYEKINRIYKGVIAAKTNNKWGIISNQGNELTSFEFDNIDIKVNSEIQVRSFGIKKSNFSNEYLLISQNQEWGVIDAKGRLIIPIEYNSIYPFTNEVAIVKKQGKYGLININGKKIAEIEYDNIEPYIAGSHSLANLGVMLFVKDNKWGVLSKDGEEIVRAKYEHILLTDSKYFIVYNNEKAGILDIVKRKEVVPCKYDQIKKQGIGFDRFVFLDGLAIVVQDGKMGYIDKEGTEFFK